MEGKNKEKITKKYLSPASVSGFTTLTSFLKNSGFKNKKEVEDALVQLDGYKFHKPVRRRFPRAKILVTSSYHTISGDLAVMDALKYSNSHYSYFLACICNFSNYMWVRPIKNKGGIAVAEAIKSILKTIPTGRVKMMWFDRGKEWYNSHVESLLREQSIKLYSTASVLKASQAELAIRLIKTRLYRIMTEKKSKKWVTYLPLVARSLNSTPSPSLGNISPRDALKEENHDVVFHTKFNKLITSKRLIPKFAKNQPVLIAKTKISLGDKGFTKNFLDEVFFIEEVISGLGPVRYKLKDKDGEGLKGSFYEAELQAISSPASIK